MGNHSVPYILITPARNEERFIEKTIQSMIKQTVLPVKWVIVNDGSTDTTASIVRRYLADHRWIELVDLPVRRERNFAAKVYAFNAGQEKVKDLEYEIIGNLDADVSLEEDHFEFLLNEFAKNSCLGSRGPFFGRTDTARKPTVSKEEITFPVSVKFSDAVASKRSAAIVRIKLGASTGWQLQLHA